MGSSGGGSSSTETIRHAPYLEGYHSDYLATTRARRALAIDASPYADYTFDDIDADFFGVGYLISSFPALYDMYGKFMAGLDIESLWQKAVRAVLTPEQVQQYVVEQTEALDNKIDKEVLPEYQRNMRDLNAVGSSTFIIGGSMIEDRRVKDRSKIALEATASLIPTAEEEWACHLNYNQSVVTKYALLMKEYFGDRIATDEAHYKIDTNNKLWPFTVLDFEQKGLGAFVPKTATSAQQQANFMNTTAGKAVTTISWTAQGAYIGSAWGPWGTVIGGVIGFLVGVAQVLWLSD